MTEARRVSVLKLLRSALNIVLLLGALGVAPLLALAHFNAPLAAMLGDFASRHLPNPTLLTREKHKRQLAQSQLQNNRIIAAGRRASHRGVARTATKMAYSTGNRVLLRGAGALAVGWVPVLGTTADVISLSEDFADICELYYVLDNLFNRLQLQSGDLYRENYCHIPAEGLEKIRSAAEQATFTWQMP